MALIIHILGWSAGWLLRILLLVVAGCLFYFPIYKGVPLGFVPVGLGVGVVLGIKFLFGRRMAQGLCDLSARWFYVLLLLIPALIQILLIFIVQSEPKADGLFVWLQAKEIMATSNLDPLTYYPPAQALYYQPWFKVFGSASWVAQISQVPLFLLLIFSVYRFVRKLTTETGGRCAGLCIAYYPTFLGYVLVTPYYFYMYTLMVVVSFLGVWEILTQPARWRAGCAAGLAAGWGTLTKAVLLMFPVQALTALVLTSGALIQKGVLARWIIIMFGFTLVLAPWVIRNTHVFGEPVLVCTSGGLVMYSANNPESNGLYNAQPDTASISTPQEMLAHSRWCSAQAKAWILQEPMAFLALSAKKFLHTWGNETTFAELINVRGRSSFKLDAGGSLLFQTGWAVLVCMLSWVVWCSLRGGFPPDKMEIVLGVFICSHALVYLLYEGGARHHLPLIPLLVVYVAHLLHVHKQRRAQAC